MFCLCSVTQGNLQFVEAEEDQLKISNPDIVANIASLLATTPDAVEKALCFRVVGNKLGLFCLCDACTHNS